MNKLPFSHLFMYVFINYLATLSVVQKLQRQILRYLFNDDPYKITHLFLFQTN
jgi:hypothetical protein